MSMERLLQNAGGSWVRDRAEGREPLFEDTSRFADCPDRFNLSWSLFAMSDRNPGPSRRDFMQAGAAAVAAVSLARTASASKKTTAAFLCARSAAPVRWSP